MKKCVFLLIFVFFQTTVHATSQPRDLLTEPDPNLVYAEALYAFATTNDLTGWTTLLLQVTNDENTLQPLLTQFASDPTNFSLWLEIQGDIESMQGDFDFLQDHSMPSYFITLIQNNPTSTIGQIPYTDPPLSEIVTDVVTMSQFNVPQVPAMPPEPTPTVFAPASGSYLSNDQQILVLQGNSSVTTMVSQIAAGTFTGIATLLTNLSTYQTDLINGSMNIASDYTTLRANYLTVNTAALNVVKTAIAGAGATTTLGSMGADYGGSGSALDGHLLYIIQQMCLAANAPPYYLLGPLCYVLPANNLVAGGYFGGSGTAWNVAWNQLLHGDSSMTTIAVGGGPFGDNAIQMVAGSTTYLNIGQTVSLTGSEGDIFWVTAYIKNTDETLPGVIGITANGQSYIRNDMYYSDGAQGTTFSTAWRPVYFRIVLQEDVTSAPVTLYIGAAQGATTYWADIQMYRDTTVTDQNPGGTIPTITETPSNPPTAQIQWASLNPNLSHWPQHKTPYAMGENLLPEIQTIITASSNNTPYIVPDLTLSYVINTAAGEQFMCLPLRDVAITFLGEPYVPNEETYQFSCTITAPAGFDATTIDPPTVSTKSYTPGQSGSLTITLPSPTGSWATNGSPDPTTGAQSWTFTGTWTPPAGSSGETVGNSVYMSYPAVAPEFTIIFQTADNIRISLQELVLTTSDAGVTSVINSYQPALDPSSAYYVAGIGNVNKSWSHTFDLSNNSDLAWWQSKIVANDIGSGNPGLVYYDATQGGMVLPSLISQAPPFPNTPFIRIEGALLSTFTIQGNFSVTTTERIILINSDGSLGTWAYPWYTSDTSIGSYTNNLLQDAFWVYGSQDEDLMGTDVFEIDWEQSSAPYSNAPNPDDDLNPSHWYRANTYTGGVDGGGQHVTMTVNLFEFCTQTNPEIAQYIAANDGWFSRVIERTSPQVGGEWIGTTNYYIGTMNPDNVFQKWLIYSQPNADTQNSIPQGGRPMLIFIQPEHAYWGTFPDYNVNQFNVIVSEITVTQNAANTTQFTNGYPAPIQNDYVYTTPNTPQTGVPIQIPSD